LRFRAPRVLLPQACHARLRPQLLSRARAAPPFRMPRGIRPRRRVPCLRTTFSCARSSGPYCAHRYQSPACIRPCLSPTHPCTGHYHSPRVHYARVLFLPCYNFAFDYVDLFNIQMSPRRELGHQEVPQATVVAQFRDYHPEKFSGQGDPCIVDEWVQGLEMIFEVMDCTDRYRVLCAHLQVTGDARLWWNAYWSMRPGEKDGCTWDMCKELICENYYPTYYRAEMERQFLALKQGTRSVDEYEREFTRLGAFIPDL
ncbi:Unknown protein, partial [Striga hermonthica]